MRRYQMFCPNCGSKTADDAVFCGNCGAKIVKEQPKAEVPPEPPVRETPPVQQPVQPVVIRQEITRETLPEKFRPLTAWGYFGYSLLFSIPIVGFIFLIVFSCSGKNINRRSFARSYWCWLIIAAIVIGILAATGGLAALFSNMR